MMASARSNPTHDQQPNDPEVRAWFMQEYRQRSARMYLIAYGILKNAEDARDAVQEAALRVFRKLDSMHHKSALAGYLLVTTRNVSLDVLRKSSRMQSRDDLQPKAPTDSWRPRRDELDQLDEAFRHLPLEYQEVLYYRYKEALNAKQIAERLKITHVNARARLFRAHKSLRKELGVGA